MQLVQKLMMMFFLRTSDKAVFCIVEKQGLLVNDTSRNWYNDVSFFSLLIWEEILYINGYPLISIRLNPMHS